jgi:hypothetical protein
MVTYYELKDLICRVFGNRQDEIDDSDLVLTIRGLHYSEPKTEFILKNDELKEIFEKVNSAQIHGLELLVEHKYEVAVEIDRPIIHTMEFPQVSLDKENNIEYQIGLCSVEYCVFLLITLIEKSKQQNKRRVILPTKFRRGYPYQIDNENDEKELDWKDILIRNMREFSIKIITPNYSSLEKNRKRKEAYVFEFIYKTEQVVGEYADIEDILPTLEMGRRMADSVPNTIETIPRREYISDVVDYYRLAFSSADPYIKYISFYHIMEYFYDEVYKRKIVADLINKITHPDFSYKDEEKVYEIATFVKNRMHMNDESGQGDELESLKYVLKEYVDIEQLKNKLNSIDQDSIMFYQSNKVAFCKAPTIPWNDSEGVYNQIARRIYYTRNSLIHSKSGKNRERYKPYKDEKELQKEIPLVRVIAEMIIINSSKIV